MFLKNRNISSKIKRSKVTDYAALTLFVLMYFPIYIDTIMTRSSITGFIQGGLSKIQGCFKDFSRLFNSFQGLKV